MKAIDKELIIATSDEMDIVPNTETSRNAEESSDDDDLFDNLRKMRDHNAENDTNKSGLSKSSNEITRDRKRTRSDSDNDISRKMNKIDEADEDSGEDDSDDILSFAKKTLQHEDLPDTEELTSIIPRAYSGKCKNSFK